MNSSIVLKLLCLICLIRSSCTFYIPGVAPLDFNKGDPVEVKVDDRLLSSIETKLLLRRAFFF